MLKRSNDIDELVGCNIRLLRLNRGMLQTELAEASGLTFQQIQKYEKGRNRVGAGRLFAIAGVLGVPVSAFFEGAEHTAGNGDGQAPIVVQAFSVIDSPALRWSLIELVEVMAKSKLAGRQNDESA